MSVNPIGPLTPEEWQEAIDAPYGRAAVILRKHDPAWGFSDPDKAPRKWKVKFTRETKFKAYTTVVATTEAEAQKLTDEIDADKLDWDYDDEGYAFVASIEEVPDAP